MQLSWNRNWDLGWFWADYEQLLRAFFSCFRGYFFINFFLNMAVSAPKSCIKSLILFFFDQKNFFLTQNRLWKHYQLCLALLEIPHCTAQLEYNDFGSDVLNLRKGVSRSILKKNKSVLFELILNNSCGNFTTNWHYSIFDSERVSTHCDISSLSLTKASLPWFSRSGLWFQVYYHGASSHEW